MKTAEVHQTDIVLSGAPEYGKPIATYPYRGAFKSVWVRFPAIGVSFLSSLEKMDGAA